MCTAYEIDGSSYDVDFLVADAFEATLAEEGAYHIIRPTLKAPVVMPNGRARIMSWGFRRPVPGKQKKQLWRTIVNSREDKLRGGTWGKAFRERRCVIPAASFYEWVEGPGGKAKPLRFARPGGQRIWIAGIWEDDADRGECFSMITTEPTAEIAPIHDRMPAALLTSQILPYLAGELNQFGPSAVILAWTEAENFLKNRTTETKPQQGELF
jgi:putative SOS response-associated peptidase YedK